jgi:hypothetical protein
MSRASFVKTLLTTTALAGALGASSQASAVVADFLIPGTVCQPTQGFANCADYSQYGVHNTCSDPIVVDCPLPIAQVFPFPGNPDPQWWASIVLYDRSTTADVSCTLQAIDGYGDVYFQTTANSSLGGPGSGAQGILTTNVFMSATQWHLRCWIPGVEAPGWYSHVSGFKIGYR